MSAGAPPEDQLGAVLGGDHGRSGGEDALPAEGAVGDVNGSMPGGEGVPGFEEVAAGALPEDELLGAVLGDRDGGGGGERAQLGEADGSVPAAQGVPGRG